jgi:hypothetical protein
VMLIVVAMSTGKDENDYVNMDTYKRMLQPLEVPA